MGSFFRGLLRGLVVPLLWRYVTTAPVGSHLVKEGAVEHRQQRVNLVGAAETPRSLHYGFAPPRETVTLSTLTSEQLFTMLIENWWVPNRCKASKKRCGRKVEKPCDKATIRKDILHRPSRGFFPGQCCRYNNKRNSACVVRTHVAAQVSCSFFHTLWLSFRIAVSVLVSNAGNAYYGGGCVNGSVEKSLKWTIDDEYSPSVFTIDQLLWKERPGHPVTNFWQWRTVSRLCRWGAAAGA